MWQLIMMDPVMRRSTKGIITGCDFCFKENCIRAFAPNRVSLIYEKIIRNMRNMDGKNKRADKISKLSAQ